MVAPIKTTRLLHPSNLRHINDINNNNNNSDMGSIPDPTIKKEITK